jgi:hypothetical protein
MLSEDKGRDFLRVIFSFFVFVLSFFRFRFFRSQQVLTFHSFHAHSFRVIFIMELHLVYLHSKDADLE